MLLQQKFNKKQAPVFTGAVISDRRDSNSRLPPWQGGALPTEPLSHIFRLNRFLFDKQDLIYMKHFYLSIVAGLLLLLTYDNVTLRFS